MRILRIRAVNFRRFDDIDLSFSEGMNLIRGPNESGKSTLVAAVLAGLFARPQTNTAAVRSYMRWGTEEVPFVELEFTHEGSRFRLEKDFGARSLSLEEDGGAPLRSLKAVNAKIFELIGFNDPAKYLRTACVTHDQMVSLAEDSSGARKIAGMLREVVVGGRESSLMESAVRKLTAEVDGLKRGLDRPTGNPGTIKRLVDEREALIARQEELSASVSDLDSQRERLAETENMLAEKEPRLAELDDLLAKNRGVEQIERRMAEARRRFQAADRVRDAERELVSIDKKIDADFAGLRGIDPEVETELRKATDLRESLRTLREEVAREPVEEVERPPTPRPYAGWISIGAGVLVALLGSVLGALAHPALFSLIAAGVVLVVVGMFQLRRPSATTPVSLDVPQLLDERIRRADLEIERLEAQEREFLESVGCESAEQFFIRYAAYTELVAERGRAAAGLGALLGGRTLDQAEEERRGASLEAASCEERLSELSRYRIDPERMGALSREHEILVSAVSELRKERDGLAFHLVRTAAEPEEAARIEEELAWLWEKEQAARRRLRVYTMARDAMEQTAESLLSSAVPVLSESVGRTFAKLTGGRYDSVEVRESDLALSVFSSERGDMIPADELLASLSKGTASQLYLAARLELVQRLSGGRRPPLIFDDSFSYFDVPRLELLWNLLLEVAHEQQVMVMTCTDRYDRLIGPGINVIDLGA